MNPRPAVGAHRTQIGDALLKTGLPEGCQFGGLLCKFRPTGHGVSLKRVTFVRHGLRFYFRQPMNSQQHLSHLNWNLPNLQITPL
jgi:hypothetical protein